MEINDTKEKQLRKKVQVYFGLAFALLFVLALVWSIDASFIYLLLGISAYFFFLSFQIIRSLGSNLQKPERTQENKRTEKKIEDEINTILNPNSKNPSANKEVRRGRHIVLISVFGFFAIFVAAFAVALLSDDDMDSEYNYETGEAFYTQGNYDSAKIYFRRTLKVEEDNTAALVGYGNALQMKLQNDSALVMYDLALSFDPDYEQAHYQKGLTLFYNKKYDESISVLENLLENYSTNIDAYQVIGDDFYTQQKYDSAIRWYEKAYENNIRNRYLCHLMAYIYDTKNETAKAIGLYKEALEYDDSILEIYVRLGELLPGKEGDVYRTKANELRQTQ